MRERRRFWPALICTLGLAGCHDPEDGRPRGDGHGGDGGNYIRGGVHPPSKIDGTRDLSLLQHDGPRPRERRGTQSKAGTASGPSGRPDDRH